MAKQGKLFEDFSSTDARIPTMDTPTVPRLDKEHREFLIRTARSMLVKLPDFGIDASDAVQQAMMKAHERIHQFVGTTEGEFRSWLRKILYRELIGEIREAARRPGSQPNRADVDESVGRLEEMIQAEDTPPQVRTSRDEQYARLAEAIAALPDDQREVIKFHILEGLSIKQTALAIGKTTASVAGLYQRGLKALKGKLPDDLANPS